MAPFLFRKQKQDHEKNKSSVLVSSPSTLQSPPTTPVYARFSASSSPRDAHSAAIPARKVSLPKPLGGQGRVPRGEKGWNGVEGKYGYSTNSLTSMDRDGQRKKDVAQRSQLSGEHTLAIPASQLLLDKPLPPPVPPAEDKPIIPATPGLAGPPPTAFLTQHQSQGPISLNADKPLPRPGSSQSLLPSPGIPTSASSKSSFSQTRSPSTSSSSVRQDIQTKIQRQWSTSTSNQKISNDPNHPEPTSRKREDSPAGALQNAPIITMLVSSTSTDSIGSTSGKGSSCEDVVVDHPEALSSQNFNETNHVPSQSSSFNSRRPLLDRGNSSASGKSFDQQTFISTPSGRESRGDMTLLQPGSPLQSPTLRRGIPSPPPTPMASNASSLSRASVLSAYHELYPSHVVMNHERRSSVLDTDQQRPPLYRNHTIAPSSPPPSLNTPHADFQNGISERHPQLVYRNRNQQHHYSEHKQPALTSPYSNPVSLTKSPSLQSNPSPIPRGKPRIFAAMEAQQDLQAPSLTRESLVEEYSTPKLQIDTLPEINSYGDVGFSNTVKAIDPHNVAPGLEPHPVHYVHSRKPSVPRRPVARKDDSRMQTISQTTRTKKLSKTRHPTDNTIHAHTLNGSTNTLPGSPDGVQQKKPLLKAQSKSRPTVSSEPEPTIHLDEETIRKAGMPLDDDPFARVEGVKMLKPTTSISRHKSSKEDSLSSLPEQLDVPKEELGPSQQENMSQAKSTTDEHRQTRKDKKEKPPVFFFNPTLKKEPTEPSTVPTLLLDPQIMACLLQFLSFYEWCTLLSLSKEIRSSLVRKAGLREAALERFLKTIGYSRWAWDDEPLSLSLQDLSDYMRGVSTPTHEYSRVAAMYIHSLKMPTTHRDPAIRHMVQRFVASTRAYNRVLLRLRAQVEKEATLRSSAQAQTQSPGARARLSPTTRGGGGNSSRPSSRAPSPAASHTSIGHLMGNGQLPGSSSQANTSQTNLSFRSPLFKLRRAPLLRVFVPSQEGDWLSDKSVLECEAECKRAGVQHLLRLGDVVWDVAAGDEGNVGRLVWDGSYLIDLDFTYSAIGDLPKYLHALAFPPSYFHRVIRTGHSNSNPIVHIDLIPWGQETATNIQLIQDRIRTETSQGAYHNVMHWVNRSSFQLRPVRGQQPGVVNRIAIPNTDNLFVDPGWYGTIVVETEGTNEALADMHERCGLRTFPRHVKPTQEQIDNRKVFRILRERSRPGEIWIRAVSMDERL